MSEVLKTENLEIKFHDGIFSVKPVNISVNEGEIVSIVGESGSGKTTLLRAMTALNHDNAEISGKVIINGTDIYSLSGKELRERRMIDFSIAFQNSVELLNPRLTVGEQYEEVLNKSKAKNIKEYGIELLHKVGLSEDILEKYPHELSGGMLQRFLIVSAIALKPKVVFLDEPTSALDIESTDKVLELIKSINSEMGISFVVITHDFSVALKLSERMFIFYNGKLVEYGNTAEIIDFPLHPYTRGLINSSMDLNAYRDIWGIYNNSDGFESYEGCPFYKRCHQRLDSCAHCEPGLCTHAEFRNRYIACNRGGIVKALEAVELSKSYGKNRVLENVSLAVYSSEVVSLIGQSGSGKSTLAGILSGYLDSDSGTVMFDGKGEDLSSLHRVKNGLQIVFQDVDYALNGRMSIFDAISEPLVLNYKDFSAEELKKRVAGVLRDVELPSVEEFWSQKVKTLSGGQKQRVSIARALIMEPKVMVADEPTSMLDASTKANLIRTLKGIQNKRGLTLLFVTHDISCAKKISDRIFRLEDGGINRVVW